MKKIIIFDIDGTLANVDHRRGYVETRGKKNWVAFTQEMVNDTPHVDICWLFRTLQEQNDTTMLIATGRSESDREKTVKWLTDHSLFYVDLYMRPVKDSRPDNVVKYEMLEAIRNVYGEPFMVVEDRNSVVDMWRGQGVRCVQVAPGDF